MSRCLRFRSWLRACCRVFPYSYTCRLLPFTSYQVNGAIFLVFPILSEASCVCVKLVLILLLWFCNVTLKSCVLDVNWCRRTSDLSPSTGLVAGRNLIHVEALKVALDLLITTFPKQLALDRNPTTFAGPVRAPNYLSGIRSALHLSLMPCMFGSC